ncbi:MAG: recombination mediator RecR [Mycoplasmataceae bacterium]|jgi:recombination protein RecR|nr:recombination mediator RecR [Mycoplasmataceae bacterium]
MKPITFEYLVDALKSLPSIGKKQAERIAYFLLLQDKQFVYEFIKRITNAVEKTHFCRNCNNFATSEFCDICANPSRDQKKLCIVTSIEDLLKIEQTNEYIGLYYVLNGEIDVKTKTNISSTIIRKLNDFIIKKDFKEIIISTNCTINGEATAIFLKKIINQIAPNTSVYRLAIGLPINSSVDYADPETLKFAIRNRTKI